MARTRLLKPEYFTDEDLGEIGFEARLAFAGLWCYADKEGRLKDRPKYLKAMIFPYDDVDMNKLLNELAGAKNHGQPFIIRYEVDGERYIQIPNWGRHQRPHHTEKESDIPAPPKEKERTKEKETYTNTDTNTLYMLNASTELRNGDITVKEPLKEATINIIKHLNERTGKNFRSSSVKTRQLIKARFSEGFKLEDFFIVIDNRCDRWLTDSDMAQYLRPETLFSNKFEGYLNDKNSQTSSQRVEDIKLAIRIKEQEGQASFDRFCEKEGITHDDIRNYQTGDRPAL